MERCVKKKWYEMSGQNMGRRAKIISLRDILSGPETTSDPFYILIWAWV